MAELQTISNMLKEIRAAYPAWKPTEDTAKVWVVYLADMNDALFVASVRKFISSSIHAFAPSVSEIRIMAAELIAEVNQLPSALEAWEEVRRAKKPGSICRACDYSVNINGWIRVEDLPYEWSHRMVETLARRFGWPAFPTGENDVADRAHFIRAYDEMVKNEIGRESRLPQITQYVETQRNLLAEDRRAALETGESREINNQMFALSRRMQ